MTNELEQDHAAFKAVEVKDSPSAMQVAALAVQAVARGNECFADIQLMLQLFFCRHIDNFQSFLEETLRAIYTAQPGLLKRSDPVPVGQVLAHSTMESFTEELIEHRIQKLSYKSFRDLSSLIKEELKFPLVNGEKELAAIDLAFGVRNLVTHNYGAVNRLFLGKFPDAGVQLGQPYPVLPERIAADMKLLGEKASDIERRAVQKFKIVYPAAN